MNNISLKDYYSAIFNKQKMQTLKSNLEFNKLEKKLLLSKPCNNVLAYHGIFSKEKNWYLFDDLKNYLNDKRLDSRGLYNFLIKFIEADKDREQELSNSIVLCFPEVTEILKERFNDNKDLLEYLAKNISFLAIADLACASEKPSHFKLLKGDLKSYLSYNASELYNNFNNNLAQEANSLN